jgi:hypothetical protein
MQKLQSRQQAKVSKHIVAIKILRVTLSLRPHAYLKLKGSEEDEEEQK